MANVAHVVLLGGQNVDFSISIVKICFFKGRLLYENRVSNILQGLARNRKTDGFWIYFQTLSSKRL